MAKKQKPTVDDVKNFVLLEPMIESLAEEMRELSKKKADGPLNTFKVGMINKRLKPLKEIVSSLPIAMFLDELDEEILPSNSDVVLILGQYEGALKGFRKSFRGQDHSYRSGWITTSGFIADEDLE